jgi:hypothetical protein
MRQYRAEDLDGTLPDRAGITMAACRDAHQTDPVGTFTRPCSGIEVALLLRRYHG